MDIENIINKFVNGETTRLSKLKQNKTKIVFIRFNNLLWISAKGKYSWPSIAAAKNAINSFISGIYSNFPKGFFYSQDGLSIVSVREHLERIGIIEYVITDTNQLLSKL